MATADTTRSRRETIFEVRRPLSPGWHALSGFLVVIPVLLALGRPHMTALLVTAAAGGLIATAIWALFDTQVAGGLFYFPNNETDALLHFGTSAIFLAGAAHYFVRERSAKARLGLKGSERSLWRGSIARGR